MSAQSPPPALSAKDVTVVLGNSTIVDDISMEVETGEIVALIGPNGAGKTTFLKAVLGLLPIRGGQILFNGVPLASLGPARARLGYVPQRLELDRTIPVTVEELVAVNTPRPYFSPGALRRALAEVDAESIATRQVGQLSGGELQRVLLAMNLLRDPRILFLDEPSTGIDIEGERLFYDILEHLRSDRGMAVLMVSHDISVVYRFASRVVCINRRLMCQGKPGDVLNDDTLERIYGHATAVYEHHNP